MHNPDYIPSTTNLSSTQVSAPIRVQFSTLQLPPGTRTLSDLIRERTQRKEFFYGIELTARSFGDPFVLDYNSFGTVLPLFTSLVWLGQDYAKVDRVADVESVRFALKLFPQTIVMPHFSCYCANSERLAQILDLNFSNILALRGDQVEQNQEYQHASDLVAEIRRLRGDTISIGVAGHPEGHPDAKSLEDDMQYLSKKVNAGADFIITQICFSPSALIEFIKRCRSSGINVPIIIGVFVPGNLGVLQRMCEITQVQIPAADLSNYEAKAHNHTEFRKYAELKALELINAVFESNLNVYGVQFFTTNRLKSVQRVLRKIVANNMENKIL